MNPAEWPWYEVVNDDSLDQGDIIPGCLVLHAVDGEGGDQPEAELRPATILVLTQTCDLAWAKTDSVLVCAIWSVAAAVVLDPTLRREAQATADRTKTPLPEPDATDIDQKVERLVEQSKALRKELNAIMKGERPPFAMLEAHSAVPALPRSIASFQHVYSMPRPMLARFAAKANPRLRLLPPYREHLSHSFGRYFSRIGLLQDIPRYPP